MRTITSLFGKSPFVPLQEHNARVMETVKLIRPLFEALDDGDEKKWDKICETINLAENEADMVKNRYRDEMPKGLFLPVSRRDLLEIISTQDGVADSVQDIAELVRMRETVILPKMKDELFAYIDKVVETCEKACEVINRLDELLEVSFGGREANRVFEMIDSLGQLEHEADKAGKVVAKKLFRLEKKLDPVSVFMWSHILTRLGKVANHAENIGNHIRLLLA